MQERATLFLQPDGESESEFVNFIIGILDGPEQRLAQSTPAQCLADHDYNIAKNAFINGVNYAKKRPDVILHKVIEMVAGDYAYGEQLRQQFEVGDL